jgi:haloacetate dehalogenase
MIVQNEARREVAVPSSTRREFIKKSMGVTLGPIAAESAFLTPDLWTERANSLGTPAEFFESFKHEQINTTGATINVVYGGKGAPVLLLHGIPQTHLLWRKIAPLLAQDFFLVITDLRGYGDSSKPPGGENHVAYSKRVMAQDQVEVMQHLGFQKFAVVGHDRGGRVAHRMALDHADRLTKLTILDIVPTYTLYQNVSKEFATTFYHWFLLVQPAPFPETVIANSAEYFLKSMLFRLGGEVPDERIPDWVGEAAFAEYLRCFRDPSALHGICEDYRAAASIDLVHDSDQNQKIQCPLLVLWAEKGPFHRMYNVLETWRDRANSVHGKALPAGHFLPEQIPEELARELKAFLSV